MRLIFLYIFLIGIPVLATIGLLRMGRDLKPPISIKGTWVADVDPQALSESPGDESLCFDHMILTITQSGSRLLLTFNDKRGTTLDGQIQDATIIAEAPHNSATAANEQGIATIIRMRAGLDRQTEPQRLLGVLTFNGCSSRTQVRFVATRL